MISVLDLLTEFDGMADNIIQLLVTLIDFTKILFVPPLVWVLAIFMVLTIIYLIFEVIQIRFKAMGDIFAKN